jgi:hypothetical protein
MEGSPLFIGNSQLRHIVGIHTGKENGWCRGIYSIKTVNSLDAGWFAKTYTYHSYKKEEEIYDIMTGVEEKLT